MREEMSDHQILKMLVQTLNDIRVLLNDIYTREYILESLKQSSASQDFLKESLKVSGTQKEE